MKTVKKRSQKQEKSVANQFDAKTVVASGALWGAKGDVRNSKFLIECKTTEKDYYPLTSKVWEKIEEEAVRDHDRIPLMVIDLRDSERFVVFDPRYFETPLNYQVPLEEIKKSIRIKDHRTYYRGEYISSHFFTICGKKKNMLCCMYLEDFIKYFKEEL